MTTATTPTVSVIIPTYQGAATLATAVESALAQTLTNLEVIIVDDGSTDATPAVAAALMAQDARVLYLQKTNGGPASARNDGAARARGRFLAFLDADDRWLPGKLAGQVRLLDAEPRADLVFTDSENISDEAKASGRFSDLYRATFERAITGALRVEEDAWLFLGDDWRATLFRVNVIHTSTVVIRSDRFRAVGGFDTQCMGTEDYDLWLRLTPTSGFLYWGVVCAQRYKTEKSLSWRSERWLREQVRLFSSYRQRPDLADLRGEIERKLIMSYRTLVRYYGRVGERGKAWATFRDSLPLGVDRQTAIYALAALTLGDLPFRLASWWLRRRAGVEVAR